MKRLFPALRIVQPPSLCALAGILLTGCAEQLPEVVPLAAGADQVEVVSDTPSADVYRPIGGVSARVAGNDVASATREAKNELRNQTTRKGGSLVLIQDTLVDNSFMSPGRIVVAMTGTAYKSR
jgi:hypothetical protein